MFSISDGGSSLPLHRSRLSTLAQFMVTSQMRQHDMCIRCSARVRTRSRGFTLVELLVVIAIIGLLVALLLPAVNAAREASRRTQCSNNLKQLSLAAHGYQGVNRILPPAGLKPCKGILIPDRHASGFVAMLPFHEQSALFEAWDFTNTPDFPANLALAIKQRPPEHICPSMQYVKNESALECDSIPSPSSYALCTGSWYRGFEDPNDPNRKPIHNGAFVNCGPEYRRVSIDRISSADGTTQTILMGEMDYGLNNYGDGAINCYIGGFTAWNVGYFGAAWASTAGTFNSDHNTKYEYQAFRSEHPGGVNISMVDASVHFVPDTIDHNTLDAMGTRAGHETIDLKDD